MGGYECRDGPCWVHVDTESGEIAAERSVRRSGNSTVVTLPPVILSATGMDDGEELTVTARADGAIELQPAEPDE